MHAWQSTITKELSLECLVLDDKEVKLRATVSQHDESPLPKDDWPNVAT